MKNDNGLLIQLIRTTYWTRFDERKRPDEHEIQDHLLNGNTKALELTTVTNNNAENGANVFGHGNV